MQVHRVADGTAQVISVSGEVDIDTVGRLSAALDEGMTELSAGGTLVLDLRAVEFFGAAGVSVLMRTHRRCDAVGVAQQVVTGANRTVLRPLTTLRLERELTLITGPDLALVPDPDPTAHQHHRNGA